MDRTSARVQAVVTLFGPSDFRNQPVTEGVRALLGPLIKERGEEAALSMVSPATHIAGDEPPFLLIHGDKDTAVPLFQSTHLQAALKSMRVPCDLIVIPNGPHATGSWHRVPGVPDWEWEMTEWLNKVLSHKGAVGKAFARGARARLIEPADLRGKALAALRGHPRGIASPA